MHTIISLLRPLQVIARIVHNRDNTRKADFIVIVKDNCTQNVVVKELWHDYAKGHINLHGNYIFLLCTLGYEYITVGVGDLAEVLS